MNSITWLHFSDIHICNPKSGWEADVILEKLQEDLKRLLHDHNLKPDFIVFTGDAVYGHLGNDKGKKISDQFESAAILFNEICSLYDPPVPKSHFFIVPGNHELNRSKVPGMIHEGLKASLSNKSHDEMEKKLAEVLRDNTSDWKTLMVSLEDYKAFLDEYEFVNDLDKDRLIWGKVIEINGIKIGIAGMNSAWSCGMDKHKGEVLLSGHWQIPTLSKMIKDGQIKIAMMHHPVNWLMPFEDPAVKKELGNNFDFFLHGHEHQNWVDEQADGFVTIAAGACYGDSEKETGYNIVRLFPENGDGEVWLRKYDKDGHGWIPKIIYNKTDNDGIWRIRNWGQRLRKQEKSAQSLKSELISGPTVSKKETSTVHDNRCDIDSQTNSGNTYDDFSPESRGLFGRKKEIAELSRLLDKYRIVTVCGLSGIGKTSLIRETCRTESLQNRLYMTLKSHNLISSHEIFRHFSRVLGCNDESPDMVFNILKMSEFKELKEFVKDSESAIIHIEDSHFFFEMTGGTSRFLDSSIKNLFEAIAEYYPQIHIILESRETISDSILPEKFHKKINIKGIDKESMGHFFIRPFKNEPEKGWHLDENDIEFVFKKLGGDSNKEKAHPLAMSLLANVADGMKEIPRQVLKRYDGTKELHEKLDNRLFNDLYANILTEKAQRMLRICALYNDFIPDSHVTALNKAVNDDDAFQFLLRRYILNIKGEGDRYSLHSLLADLTKKYLENRNDEKLENHKIIADAWLAGLKISNHYSSPNIIATNEALYHLIESGEYTRLHEIQEKLLSRGYIEVLEK
ncbi:metallophosphoesterase [Desulforegula conservatrix]|uniref:metallophosphoesterase n=1 Tax=Desulforegula conservatrix TaxID=153026 RepID=UPI000406D38E|nr:metallophosphoesterase [Desulforegula conservatrix]